MAKEIIINAEKKQTRIAILEDSTLAELRFEDTENERTIGNIFLGKVRRIMPNIRAAFVDIGQKQDAFLHFTDLSSNFESTLEYLSLPAPEVSKINPVLERPGLAKKNIPQTQLVGDHPASDPFEEDTHDANGSLEDDRKRPQTRGRQTREVRTDDRRRSERQSHQRSTARYQDGRAKQDRHVSDDKAEDEVPVARTNLHELLRRDQRVLVKIVKEPISNKGSRVSTDISLAGRFLVLVPLANYVAVSKKIYSYKERRRLRTLARSLVPDGFGVIVRTVAQNKNARALDTDLRLLVEKWRKIEKRLNERRDPPVVLYEDVNMVSSIIRDLFSDDYDRILIDEPRLHRNIRNYVQAVAPHMAPAVQLYTGKKHIFKSTKIDKAVLEAFQSRVELASGGYLFFEQTEAMHVIDVNSGRAGRGLKQEDNSLKVNLEAARVVAKQARLRDLGGILVVDFIDLRDDRNRKKVFDELRKQFRKDRAVTKVLPMSDFGLMQITRQRLRPSITTSFEKPENIISEVAEKNGDDEEKELITPDQLISGIEKGIEVLRKKSRKLGLRVHPFTAAYLKQHRFKLNARWWMKKGVRIKLEDSDKLSPNEFEFFDIKTGKNFPLSSTNGQA